MFWVRVAKEEGKHGWTQGNDATDWEKNSKGMQTNRQKDENKPKNAQKWRHKPGECDAFQNSKRADYKRVVRLVVPYAVRQYETIVLAVPYATFSTGHCIACA
eukprot:1561958-Rhodomonas_salina.2